MAFLLGRSSKRFLVLAAILLTASACGVKQNNSRLKKDSPNDISSKSIFGPFYSGSQGDGSLTTNPATCGSPTRPCLKMRASVGLPYQFDTNKNAKQGPLVAGTSYLPAPNPYITQISGPGKVKPTASIRSDQPQLENKDLKMMQRQTASGEYSIP